MTIAAPIGGKCIGDSHATRRQEYKHIDGLEETPDRRATYCLNVLKLPKRCFARAASVSPPVDPVLEGFISRLARRTGP